MSNLSSFLFNHNFKLNFINATILKTEVDILGGKQLLGFTREHRAPKKRFQQFLSTIRSLICFKSSLIDAIIFKTEAVMLKKKLHKSLRFLESIEHWQSIFSCFSAQSVQSNASNLISKMPQFWKLRSKCWENLQMLGLAREHRALKKDFQLCLSPTRSMVCFKSNLIDAKIFKIKVVMLKKTPQKLTFSREHRALTKYFQLFLSPICSIKCFKFNFKNATILKTEVEMLRKPPNAWACSRA